MPNAATARKKYNPLLNTLTVDPGNNTGWALWNSRIVPTRTGQITKPRSMKDHIEILEYMIEMFRIMVELYSPEICVIEGVELWGASAKSYMAGVDGDLMQLSYMVGGYLTVCFARGIKCELIPARGWKGQMPNDVLKRRIKLAIQETFRTEHIDCAVGIGLHKMGIL